MKNLLISVFISISGSLFPQILKDYIIYHQTCRQAEKFFIDSNYTSCFLTYDDVFRSFDFLFPRDCFTAAQLAFKTGKDSLAVEYLKKGVPFGLNANQIFNTDTGLLIGKIRSSRYWTGYMADFFPLRQQYVRRVDWTLKKQLLELVKEDQKWRQKNNKLFNRIFRKDLEKQFRAVNKRHINFLDSVFRIKGYPGIWLTGVGDSTNLSFDNNGNLSEVFFVILYHYDSAFVQYGDFLKNEITNGHLHPRTYAMIKDFTDRHLVKANSEQKMYYNICGREQTTQKMNMHNIARKLEVLQKNISEN